MVLSSSSSSWEGVRDEWHAQLNQTLPALTDTAALASLITAAPDDLFEAGRWCSNPFALLDHLTTDAIREWAAPRWSHECVAGLRAHVAAIADAQIQATLTDWVDAIAAASNMDVALSLHRDDQRWKMLKEYAPKAVKGTHKVPLLAQKYYTKHAYVIVLDQLFPDLAQHVASAAGYPAPSGLCPLGTVYETSRALRDVLDTAITDDSWEPVATWVSHQCPVLETNGIAVDAPTKNRPTHEQESTVEVGAWLHSFFQPAPIRPAKQHQQQYPAATQFGVLSQNVRGFKTQDQTQEQWMAGWKLAISGKKLYFIALQEIHVTSTHEAERLASKWSRSWGLHHDPAAPMSFWTVTSSKAGGVAILLHPSQRTAGYVREEDPADGGRYIRVTSPERSVINVYAPNKRTEREAFFQWMHQRVGELHQPSVIVGDFNCVLDSATDRVIDGRWGPRRSESPALERLVHDGRLTDAYHLHTPGTAALDSITYWQGTSGARLDRAYISHDLAGWVTAVDRILPHCASDHCGLVVWLRDPELRPLLRPLEAPCYPVHGRDPLAMDRHVGAAVVETLNAAQSALHKIKRDEKKRAARQRKRKEAKLRKSISTLKELIEYVTLRVARRARTNRQVNLLQKSGNPAHLFRRFVHMDQRRPITLQINPELTGGPTQTMADVMAADWKPLLGERHATVPIGELGQHCAELFTIPVAHRLNSTDQQQLMVAITEEEVLQAIDGLGAHKAAGPDRIGNDFYKDWKDLVAPWLQREFDKILAGNDPPPSFAEAIIVPIPKPGGDPSSALNFRPILLLPSGYKIFTKLLATGSRLA